MAHTWRQDGRTNAGRRRHGWVDFSPRGDCKPPRLFTAKTGCRRQPKRARLHPVVAAHLPPGQFASDLRSQNMNWAELRFEIRELQCEQLNSQVSISLIIHGLWWTVSGEVKAHVVLTCTNGASPNHLPVILASDRPWTILSTCAQNLKVDWIYSTKRTMTHSYGWNLQRLQHSRNNNSENSRSGMLVSRTRRASSDLVLLQPIKSWRWRAWPINALWRVV